jgi:tripartite ATP-independent transporter DctP family solute receptor
MKKNNWTSAVLVVCVFFLCFSGVAEARGKKINLRMQASYNPKSYADQPSVVATLRLVEEMKKRVGDKINVKIYWEEQLAKTYEASVNLVQNNNLQWTMIPMSTFSEFSRACVPLTNFFVIPYPHAQIAYNIVDGKVGNVFRERVIEETGLRIMAYWEVGFRHLLAVDKPITDLESIKGMKFRVQPNPVHLAAFKLLGANPTPIAWSELFTSLQQRVVDGTENPFENVMGGRLYEVCKHMTLTGHLFEFVVYVTNEEWYQSLPDDVRTAFDESTAIATQAYRDQMAKKNAEWAGFFRDQGMNIRELSLEELGKFREAVKPSYEESMKLVDEEYFKEIMAEINNEEKVYFEQHPELKP